MRLKFASLLLVTLLLASTIPTSLGNSSGIYNRGSSGCGGGYCHGSSNTATVSMSGQPSSYNPGQTYTLSISVSGGVQGTNGGFSLDVNKGTLSTGGGVGIMAVKVNGAQTSATHTTNSYRSWSVDWTAPTAGSGSVQFNLAGLTANGANGNNGDAWGTTTITVPEGGSPPQNNAPTATNLQLFPSNPVTTDTLTLTYTYQDSDNDPESGTQIRWYRDGQLVSSLNDQTTVPSSSTTKGETWNVTVTPSDGTDDGAPAHSSTLLVVNSIPVVNSAEITPSDALESDDLTIVYMSSDADNDPRTYETEWYVDGSKVSAFDGDTTIPSVAIRDGDIWYAKIRVNDGEANSDWFTTENISIGSDNTAPTMVSVSITGGPFTTLDDLQATAQATDDDNDALTYEWDWPGSMGVVSSSTLPSFYTSKGESWKVKVRVTDGKEYSEWMESSAVVIQNTPPVLSNVEIEQDRVYFDSEATYTFDASDVDGDQLQVSESWSLNGDILTLSLSVYDNEMAYSNTLIDTVQIANSLPTLSYNGPTSQSALVDLSPAIESDDANGDTVTMTWSWMRNGFMTDDTETTIPANKLAAGDVWTAMVTPNDGMDDGVTLMVDFTINNTAPNAEISSPDDLIKGASVTFSAMNSNDIDGAVVKAIWSIDGTPVHQGMTYTTTMPSALDLTVKVFDDLGAHDEISESFVGTAPPKAMDVKAKLDGSDVILSWTGQSDEWAIVYNGEVIDTTSSLTYTHTPIVEGQHNYSVFAVVGGEAISDSSAGSSTSIELSTSLVPESPGPSETAGLVFSIILLLIGFAGVGFSFMSRRD